MKLVILAGGLGTRISEETNYIPKPMVLIGKKPILWHIIKYYSTFGISNFIICGGYKQNLIKNYFNDIKKKKSKIESKWEVVVVNTGKKSNTGERLRRVQKYLDSTFCLTYGDGLCDVNINNLLSFHKKNKVIKKDRIIISALHRVAKKIENPIITILNTLLLKLKNNIGNVKKK